MLDEAGALAALTALAQETRLRALRALLHAYPAGLPAGRLGAALGCAPSTLTFHLRQLQEAGLIDSRREGRSVVYTAHPAGLAGLTDYLTKACCGGRPEACLPAGTRPGTSPPAPAACCGGAETPRVGASANDPARPLGAAADPVPQPQ